MKRKENDVELNQEGVDDDNQRVVEAVAAESTSDNEVESESELIQIRHQLMLHFMRLTI